MDLKNDDEKHDCCMRKKSKAENSGIVEISDKFSKILIP